MLNKFTLKLKSLGKRITNKVFEKFENLFTLLLIC